MMPTCPLLSFGGPATPGAVNLRSGFLQAPSLLGSPTGGARATSTGRLVQRCDNYIVNIRHLGQRLDHGHLIRGTGQRSGGQSEDRSGLSSAKRREWENGKTDQEGKVRRTSRGPHPHGVLFTHLALLLQDVLAHLVARQRLLHQVILQLVRQDDAHHHLGGAAHRRLTLPVLAEEAHVADELAGAALRDEQVLAHGAFAAGWRGEGCKGG